jgi:hypothetical protein
MTNALDVASHGGVLEGQGIPEDGCIAQKHNRDSLGQFLVQTENLREIVDVYAFF